MRILRPQTGLRLLLVLWASAVTASLAQIIYECDDCKTMAQQIAELQNDVIVIKINGTDELDRINRELFRLGQNDRIPSRTVHVLRRRVELLEEKLHAKPDPDNWSLRLFGRHTRCTPAYPTDTATND